MLGRKLNPGLLAAVRLPTELFQAAGSSQSTSPARWHPGLPLRRLNSLCSTLQDRATAWFAPQLSRAAPRLLAQLPLPPAPGAGTGMQEQQCLCRLGLGLGQPGSLSSRNPYLLADTPSSSRGSSGTLRARGTGKEAGSPLPAALQARSSSAGSNPTCALASQADPRKPQLQPQVCSGEKGTLVSPCSQTPLAGRSGAEGLLRVSRPPLDLVFPRPFPLSSYSPALQRWELLKAFGLDAELFTDIVKSHFLSRTCLGNSVMRITVIKDYIPILNITSCYIFSHCLSRLKTKLCLPQLYQSPLSQFRFPKVPNEK